MSPERRFSDRRSADGINMGKVTLLKYSNTNTYLIEGSHGAILFDTGWAGTFNEFCRALGEAGKKLQDISYIFISHFHPDHMGIAQEIANHGPVIVVADVQKDYIHSADSFFIRNRETSFIPIDDEKVKVVTSNESSKIFESVGLHGSIIYTPGHSDDSITLWLHDGELFVGDLNPLYELQLHEGTEIGRSWKKLLMLSPRVVYYGHAKSYVFYEDNKDGRLADYDDAVERLRDVGGHEDGATMSPGASKDASIDAAQASANADMYRLVSKIMKYIDKGYPLDKIEEKTGADSVFIEDVNRMYLTHRNVGVQGILDRIEIKNR